MNQDEISEKLVEVDALGKSNQYRMDAMEKRQDNLEQLTCFFRDAEGTGISRKNLTFRD